MIIFVKKMFFKYFRIKKLVLTLVKNAVHVVVVIVSSCSNSYINDEKSTFYKEDFVQILSRSHKRYHCY